MASVSFMLLSSVVNLVLLLLLTYMSVKFSEPVPDQIRQMLSEPAYENLLEEVQSEEIGMLVQRAGMSDAEARARLN